MQERATTLERGTSFSTFIGKGVISERILHFTACPGGAEKRWGAIMGTTAAEVIKNAVSFRESILIIPDSRFHRQRNNIVAIISEYGE